MSRTNIIASHGRRGPCTRCNTPMLAKDALQSHFRQKPLVPSALTIVFSLQAWMSPPATQLVGVVGTLPQAGPRQALLRGQGARNHQGANALSCASPRVAQPPYTRQGPLTQRPQSLGTHQRATACADDLKHFAVPRKRLSVSPAICLDWKMRKRGGCRATEEGDPCTVFTGNLVTHACVGHAETLALRGRGLARPSRCLAPRAAGLQR